MQCWISLTTLDWPGVWGGGTSGEVGQWHRAYEMLRHVDRRLSGQPDEFARTDAVATLKRAVDHRIRVLDEKYGLRGLPVREKPEKILDLLEWVGLIRPAMFRKLIELRNAVEHEDHPPSDAENCRVLADFAWFFMKATDRYVQLVVERFVLKEDHSSPSARHWIQVAVEPPRNWAPHIDGWLPPSLISDVPIDGWLQANLQHKETWADVSARMTCATRLTHSPNRTTDDIRFVGEVRGPAHALHLLYRQYFSLA
jgi:hypothetical protein